MIELHNFTFTDVDKKRSNIIIDNDDKDQNWKMIEQKHKFIKQNYEEFYFPYDICATNSELLTCCSSTIWSDLTEESI